MASKKSVPKGDRPSGGSRKVLFLLLLAGGLGGGWWVYNHLDRVQGALLPSEGEEVVETFETAIAPEDIIAKQQQLLPSKQHSLGPITTFFSPHLLIQAKYSSDGKSSQASTMLWDMTDGELVLDTNGFAHTQGFADCLASDAGADDFRILHLLARRGPQSKESIVQELGGGSDSAICDRIDGLRKKHLVLVSNDMVRIHVESPLLKIEPVTRITRPFVHRSIQRGSRIASTHSKEKIAAIVQAAFGPDLAIRSSRIIYVPTYEVQISNPDGSVRKTYWNAICGQEMWPCERPAVPENSLVRYIPLR